MDQFESVVRVVGQVGGLRPAGAPRWGRLQVPNPVTLVGFSAARMIAIGVLVAFSISLLLNVACIPLLIWAQHQWVPGGRALPSSAALRGPPSARASKLHSATTPPTPGYKPGTLGSAS